MSDDARRLALLVASQCQNMLDLPFLPPKRLAHELDERELSEDRRLILELRTLLVDGPGWWRPVTHGEEEEPAVLAPGLLVNPTRAQADAALGRAIREAHERDATLLVFYVGHGVGYQADPAQAVHHFLQVWDTAEMPASIQAPDNGWDPYATIDALRPACPHITGLILVVDACFGSWAVQRVKQWAGVNARFRSVWLASSQNEAAYDGCLTQTFVRALRDGVPAHQHPDRALQPRLRGELLAYLVEQGCRGQTPSLDGFQYWDPAMFVATNRAAEAITSKQGVDPATGDYLLRLLEHYQPHFLTDVVTASETHRVLTIVGEAGSGKSSLAAALYQAHGDALPLDFVTHAIAFTSVNAQVTDLATTIHNQLLARIVNFDRAATSYKTQNLEHWERLDPFDRLVLGPLSLLRSQPVRIVLDGLEQLRESNASDVVADAIRRIESDKDLSRVRLILTSRPGLPRMAEGELPLADVTEATARNYLRVRGVPAALHEKIARLAAGRWLVLQLAADYLMAHPHEDLDVRTVEDLYNQVLDKAAVRLDWKRQLRPVLSVLAAAGPGPVLPVALLAHASAALGGPTTRVGLAEVLADRDLYRIIDRVRPGTPHEHVGLFHATLAASLAANRRLSLD